MPAFVCTPYDAFMAIQRVKRAGINVAAPRMLNPVYADLSGPAKETWLQINPSRMPTIGPPGAQSTVAPGQSIAPAAVSSIPRPSAPSLPAGGGGIAGLGGGALTLATPTGGGGRPPLAARPLF